MSWKEALADVYTFGQYSIIKAETGHQTPLTKAITAPFQALTPPTAPAAPTLPETPVPTQAAAAQTAQEAQDAQRRAALQSGGQVSFTGPGGAPVLSGQTYSPTLLGG